MNIPTEVIEKAAEAIRNDMGCEFWHDGEGALCQEHDETRETDEQWVCAPAYARVALTAAAPHLMAMAWDEVSDFLDDEFGDGAGNFVHNNNPYRTKEQP